MKVQNLTSRTLEVAGQTAGPGEAIEVDDDIGKSLCEQVDRWAKSTSKSPKKAASSGEEE